MAVTQGLEKGKESLNSVRVDYYASASRSCQSKHDRTALMIQSYLDNLQDRFGLPRFNYANIGETGGCNSINEDDITKWWFVFWEGQPSFWFSQKKSNGEDYGLATLVRYMPSVKNQLKKKFITSRYLKVIEESFNSAFSSLKAMVKERKKVSPSPPKNKVYTTADIAFILERCLWFNTAKYIDFYVFQTCLLRLCSRGTETSRLQVQNLSVREITEGLTNHILQCYLVRDKNSVDQHHPMLPNKAGVFGDLVVAIGLALFVHTDGYLMPSIATLAGESAVSAYYTTVLGSLWKRYPPAENQKVRKGTSHFGKHTAQFQLDSVKLHIAAQLYGGWKPPSGARAEYFSNPFPYLLDGAKALTYWSKVGNDYQAVRVPSYDVISKDIGDRICSAFFGHIPDDLLCVQAKQMILVCILSKWGKLLDHIRAEPNGLFEDPSNHIIVSTLVERLTQENIGLDEFEKFKSRCENLFIETNLIDKKITPPLPSTIGSPTPTTTTTGFSPFQAELKVQPLAALLDLVTRNTSPQTVLVNFFACNFMDSYKSTAKVPTRLQHKYRKIKAAVRVMVRFLDSYPIVKLTIEDANVAMQRIKNALMSEASSVKHQGKKTFGITTPLCLSIIRANETFLTDKSKSWYRTLPRNTPSSFLEHVYAHKIYDVE